MNGKNKYKQALNWLIKVIEESKIINICNYILVENDCMKIKK